MSGKLSIRISNSDFFLYTKKVVSNYLEHEFVWTTIFSQEVGKLIEAVALTTQLCPSNCNRDV